MERLSCIVVAPSASSGAPIYVQFEFTFTGLILSSPVCDTDVDAFICKLDCRYSPSAAALRWSHHIQKTLVPETK